MAEVFRLMNVWQCVIPAANRAGIDSKSNIAGMTLLPN